jgi:hypothetical protein
MRSVADDLRRRTLERVLAMTISERIALALSLGDQDVALFARMSGLNSDEAGRRIRARRGYGRAPSTAASVRERP